MSTDLPPVHDLADRCRSAVRREWLRLKTDTPWNIERPYLLQFIREDELGLGLPRSWRKLLTVANVEPEYVALLPEALRLTPDDFAELQKWANGLGPFSPLPEREVEDLEDKLPPATTSSIPTAALEEGKEERRNRSSMHSIRNNFPFAACLAALVAVSAFSGFQLFRASQNPTGDSAVATRNAALQSEVQSLTASLAETREANTVLRQSQDNGQIALKKANDSLGQLKDTLVKLSKETEGLRSKALLQASLQQKVAALTRENERSRIPAVNLKFGVSAGDVGSEMNWKTAGPSYSAVRDSRPTFRWTPSSIPSDLTNVQIRIFRDGKAIGTSLPIPAKQGQFKWPTDLPRGRNYEWLLRSDSTDLGWIRIPFYVLSPSQNLELARELTLTRTNTQRAAALERFQLFDEMIAFGGSIERDAKESIQKIATK